MKKTSETLYKKVGRRYVAVGEYSNEAYDHYREGSHLIVCQPGLRSSRFNIDPALAPMIAAGVYAEEAVSAAIIRGQEMRAHTRGRELTKEQKQAWEDFVKVMGENGRYLEWPSAREATQAGVEAMVKEASKLLKHEAVRQAYNHFLMMCALSKDSKTD